MRRGRGPRLRDAWPKHKRGRALTTLVAGLLLVSTLSDASAQEARRHRGMAVSVSRVEQHCFEDRIPFSGVLIAKREFDIRPAQDGMVVERVLIEPGDTVVKGQNLAQLIQPPGAPPANATVKSPAAGVIIRVSAVVGSYTSANAGDPLFKLVVDGELELKGDIVASEMVRVQTGQVAHIRMGPNASFTGRVASKDPAVDSLTQLGSVRVTIDGDAHLVPGAFAGGYVDAGRACNPAVPLSAVLYGVKGIIVQVVQAGEVETRRVSIGQLDKELAEIRDGLSAGDLVVTRGGAFLREGDRVRPIPEGSVSR